MKYLQSITNFFNNHKAFSLTAINILFAILIFVKKDPFLFFEKSYEKAPSFFQITESNIGKILMQRPNDTSSRIELTLENNIWKVKLEKGLQLRADDDKVKSFIKSLVSAKKFTVMTNSKEKHSEYGFSGSDPIEIEVFDNANTSKGKLSIGNNGSGGFTYVLWNNENEVYLVEDNLKTQIGRGAIDHFINKKINPESITNGDITNITQKNSKNDYDILKSGTDWVANGKINIPNDKFIRILNRITSISADDVLVEKEVPELKEKLNILFSYTYKNGESARTISLEILGKDASKYYYLKRNSEPSIYKVNEYNLKELLEFDPKNPDKN